MPAAYLAGLVCEVSLSTLGLDSEALQRILGIMKLKIPETYDLNVALLRLYPARLPILSGLRNSVVKYVCAQH